MAGEKKPEILIRDLDPGESNSPETTFEVVLDTTCDRLWEKRIQYSIKRINEMDEELNKLEKELEEFIGHSS